MPIFNEFNITKTSDIAWDGGKPAENLIPNDGDVVFDPTGGGGRTTVLLPYIEQHGQTDDGGFIKTSSKGWNSVGVIAIIAPADLNEVDVGHADLLFSENAPSGAGCSVYICGQNSPQASPEPVTHAGWGHFEIVLDGSSPTNTRYANPSSFQIVSAGPSPLESDYSGAHALYQDVMIV